MKKLALALLLVLAPTVAHATCTGVFQPNTICGNNSASPKPPFEISASGNITGPGTSVVGDLALWNNLTGSSLKDQAPGALTLTNDTNITGTLGGAAATSLVNAASITFGWSGTLAAARLNSNVVQSIVNDTNVTGSIAAQALTLGWTGTLAAGRLNSNVVQAFTNDTNVTASITAQNATLGWTGTLAVARGGTGAGTQGAAAINLFPTPVNTGDVVYWNGSAWTTLAGNTSGTQVFTENSSGQPAWTTVAGTGTVTSITQGPGLTFSSTPCTSSCTITNANLPAPQGRLTLTANTPVMTATAAAQTTLRYDCYTGSRVPYFDGTNDQIDTIAACEVTDTMISAASAGQVVSGNVYDVWWAHGGTQRICLAMSAGAGGAGGWASDTGGTNTHRGTGYTQLDRVTRPYITNTNSITHCFNSSVDYGPIPSNQATYLGTVYASANGQISYIFGAAASGGTAGLLGVWNMYNRRNICTTVTDTGTSYPYAASTVRQARASAGNQIQFVLGVIEDGLNWTYAQRGATSNVLNSFYQFGVGFDTTTVFSLVQSTVQTPAAAQMTSGSNNSGVWNGIQGLHTLSANESGDGTNNSTLDNASTNALSACLQM